MRLSERIYRILLKAYPRRYRERYEAPMAQLFADQLHDAKTSTKLVRLWLRTAADLACTVPSRYFEHRQGAFRDYDESAKRSIFFARYAALAFAHREITPEDILTGVLREDKKIKDWLAPGALEQIREMLGGLPPRVRSVSRNLPLSPACKQILSVAAQESAKAGAKRILARHLLAGVVSDGSTRAAQILLRHGIDLERLRAAE